MDGAFLGHDDLVDVQQGDEVIAVDVPVEAVMVDDALHPYGVEESWGRNKTENQADQKKRLIEVFGSIPFLWTETQKEGEDIFQ